MDEVLSVKLKRVCAGDRETKPIGMQGFVAGEIPADGFIVSASVDTVSAVPLYIRDEDIEKAKQMRANRGRAVPVDADSWGGE